MALSDFVMGGLLGTATGTTNVYTNQLGGATTYYPEFNQQAAQNAYGQLSQQAHVFGQAYGIVTELPEKVFKTAKGFLAELREEIDAWHGDCLRA